MAEILQDLRGEAADLDVVLDHEDAQARALDAALVDRALIGLLGRPFDLRQVQGEGRAFPGPARDVDVAPGLLREAEDLGEPEAGALADVLGGEERLEDPRQHVGCDPETGIGERHGREGAPRTGVAPDRRHRPPADQPEGQRAFAAHRIAGVDRHVDQGGLELAEIRPDVAGLVGDPGLDGDPRARDGIEHLRDGAQRGADLEDLGAEGLPAREGEELTGKLGGAVHRVGDRLDVAAPPLLREVRPLEQVGRRLDHGQQVVEVVGDAAGELAHCLQLLRLPQGFLDALALDALGLQAVVCLRQGTHVPPLLGQVGQNPAQEGLVALALEAAQGQEGRALRASRRLERDLLANRARDGPQHQLVEVGIRAHEIP